jgi:hypothetical protein
MAHETPLGAVIKGAVAGVVGTLAMDLVWFSRYRRSGGDQSFIQWDLASGTDGYENASAPAQVGKRVVEGLFQIELDPKTARPMTNVVHWATGAGWGTAHGIVHGSMAKPSPLGGLLSGAVAWGTSYATLGPIGLYKPIWEYDAGTLWKDLSAHLAFGLTTGIVFKLLSRSSV